MNKSAGAQPPGVTYPSADLCKISPTAFEEASKAVQLFGVTAEQAGRAMLALGLAAKRLEEEHRPLESCRPIVPDWWLT